MEFSPGDSFDRYRIEAVLGAGGMGHVLRAFDPKLRRRVAIKLLHRQSDAGDAAQVERMLREAQAAAALDHPGVVAVFDVGEAEGRPFLVMEYVEGRPLRSFIGKVPGAEALRWLADIARALAAAHRAGLVHRDIKPDNVMVRDDGVVKLLDFGIARRLDGDGAPSARSGAVGVAASSVAGTPRYMAPEQVQGGLIEPRTDQFGWGVLAYELLSGALPWRQAKDSRAAAIAVVTERQPTLPTDALGLPPHVGAVVDRALEKSPARRFPSMDALLRALEGSPDETSAAALDPGDPPGVATLTSATTTDPRTDAEAPGGHATEAATDRPPAPRAPTDHAQGAAPSAPPSASPSAPARRRPWRAAGALSLLGAGLAALAWGLASRERQPAAEALAAYTEGVRRAQNGGISAGVERLKSAIDEDPEFAPAYLRLAVAGFADGSMALARKSYAAASERRKRLTPRDQAILDAFAPSFEGRPRHDETARRLAELERRFAGDAEIAMFRPVVLATTGRDGEAFTALRAYLDADSAHATPWLGLAVLHARRDELTQARDALARCTGIDPKASDCVWLKGQLDALAGKCETEREDPERLLAGSRLVLDGDLAEADRLLGALPPARLPGEGARPHELRAALREEMGDLKGAAEIASAWARRGGGPRADATVDQVADDPTMIFDGVLLAAGQIDRAELSERRAGWLGAWRASAVTPNERDLWTRAYAGPARSPEDAQAALAALRGPPRRFVAGRLPGVDAARVYLLAGRADEAVPLLREATASCLAVSEPLRFVQAHALLGRALEARGDVQGACAAYGGVLLRWGKAKPRSVTADEARARREALRCEPPR